MAETFNGFIVQSRQKHLINMLEDIRVQIMIRLINQKREMEREDVVVCPKIQVKLDLEKDWAYRCEVYPSSLHMFQVRDLDDVSVDLGNRICTCRKWDLSGIPCKHVCAVAGFLNKNAEMYVHDWYHKEQYMKAYSYTIPPLASEKYWPSVELPLDPPPIRSQPGRPKKNRRRDPHENPKKQGKLSRHGTTMTCSNCKEKGHNKKGCKRTRVEVSRLKRGRGIRGRPKRSRFEGPRQSSQATVQAAQSSQVAQSSQPTQSSQPAQSSQAAQYSQPAQSSQTAHSGGPSNTRGRGRGRGKSTRGGSSQSRGGQSTGAGAGVGFWFPDFMQE